MKHIESWRLRLKKFGLPADSFIERMTRNDEIVTSYFDPRLTPDELFRHGANKEAPFRDRLRPRFESCLSPGIDDLLDRGGNGPGSNEPARSSSRWGARKKDGTVHEGGAAGFAAGAAVIPIPSTTVELSCVPLAATDFHSPRQHDRLEAH